VVVSHLVAKPVQSASTLQGSAQTETMGGTLKDPMHWAGLLHWASVSQRHSLFWASHFAPQTLLAQSESTLQVHWLFVTSHWLPRALGLFLQCSSVVHSTQMEPLVTQRNLA